MSIYACKKTASFVSVSARKRQTIINKTCCLDHVADGALRLAGTGAKAPDRGGVQLFGEAVIDVACGIGNKKCAPLCFAKEHVKLSLSLYQSSSANGELLRHPGILWAGVLRAGV